MCFCLAFGENPGSPSDHRRSFGGGAVLIDDDITLSSKKLLAAV